MFCRNETNENETESYSESQRAAPDGGYGYVIVLGMLLCYLTTFTPISCIGLLFGDYLAEIGDETSYVTTVNSVFITVFHFSGLLSNPLLQIWSKRRVGITGATLICFANIGTIFTNSIGHLIFTLGILQGLGVGLLISATLTTFNEYFTEKKNLMMSCCQTITGTFSIFAPLLCKYLLEEYGFRETLVFLAAISFHSIFVAISLHPVKWHIDGAEEEQEEIEKLQSIIQIKNEKNEKRNKSLFQHIIEEEEQNMLLHKSFLSFSQENMKRFYNSRPSVISIGSIAISTKVSKEKRKEFWKSITNSLDLSLLQDPYYTNLAVGASLALLSEINFVAILPAYLTNHDINDEDTALIMMVYFASDLACGTFFTCLLSLMNLSNRLVILISVILSAFGRIAFLIKCDYWWTIGCCAFLGSLRGFIHVPIPLMISDYYPENFSTAYTLYMVICGIASSIIWPLMNAVKYFTHNNVMVMHVLTFLFVVVAIAWILEYFYKRKEEKKLLSTKQSNINI